MTASRNPYRTAPGSEPPELAGRSGELGAAHYAIDMGRAFEPPNPLVFTGLRGMGKTALLRRVARDAVAAGGLAIVGEADRSLRFADVMRRELGTSLTASASFPKRLNNAIARLIERLPKLSYDLPHDAGSFAIEGSDGTTADDVRADDSLEETLHLLNDQLHREGRFFLIGLDEIQESPSTDLLRIIRVVHQTAGTDRPVVFIGAGLPHSGSVLKNVRTYTERWAYFRLELLSRNETFEAIDVPARGLGVTWEPAALEAVYRRSLGYPYFLQEFASASWLRHRGNVVTEDDVSSVAPGVQRMLDESVYDRTFEQLTPREARYVLALHELGPGAHHSEEVSEALGEASSALSSIRARLLKKDVIYSVARGLTEFRLPLTNEYIDRKRASLVKRAHLKM